MNKTGRIALRNKFAKYLNEHEKFDCKVHSGMVPAPKTRVWTKERHFWRFIAGTAKDGKTILIYPLTSRNERIPVSICEYMTEIAKKSQYVGCAENLGDVFCIMADDPLNYKRAKKTYYYEYWMKKQTEKKENV